MNKNAEYCSKYQNKNIDKIRQKDKERKKFERDYVKYCNNNNKKKIPIENEKRQREKETH